MRALSVKYAFLAVRSEYVPDGTCSSMRYINQQIKGKD
jgi:hypothetical protein